MVIIKRKKSFISAPVFTLATQMVNRFNDYKKKWQILFYYRITPCFPLFLSLSLCALLCMGTHQSKGATSKKETQFLKISASNLTNNKKLLRKLLKNSASMTISASTFIETSSEESYLINPKAQSFSRTQDMNGKSYYDEKIKYVLPNNDDSKIVFFFFMQ